MRAAVAANYWVYSNDLDGDIVHDYGMFETRASADLVAITVLDTAGFDPDKHIVRVCVNDLQQGWTTIWIAAPINYILHTYGGSDDSRR